MRARNTQGQALTEFLLVIPLFFVVLLGVIQFSLIYMAYQMVHYASFAACRAAIVRPCAAFHPDDSTEPNFTPAVFTAAVLATMGAAPPQCLVNGVVGTGAANPCLWTDLDASLTFLPDLPATPEVEGLDFADKGNPGEIALTKYINAAYLTSVQRVVCTDLATRPLVWTPNPLGPGPGIPCDDPTGQEQNVPPPGSDITLEVTYVYPLIVPLVNRVVYGIFVNFSSTAQDRLHLSQITGPGGSSEDVMVRPTRLLPNVDRQVRFTEALNAIFGEFGYGAASSARAGMIADGLAQRGWYPIPVRARCTLTVEGSVYPLTGPPSQRGW